MSSSPQFKKILDDALREFKEKTGKDLLDDWLAKELQTCDTVDDIMDIIEQQSKAFNKFRGGDKRLTKWIRSSVRVLHTISGILGEDVGKVRIRNLKGINDKVHSKIIVQVHPSAKPIFTGIGVLLAIRSSVFPFVHPFNADILQAAKNVWASYDTLVDLFERIHFFLKRLGVHTRISSADDMVEILVKILAEVLSILSIATKEMQQNRASKLFLR